MGRLIRTMDWSSTPLGPIDSWPQSLRTTVNLCLASDLPICIIWGPELVQLYNDGYRVICGEKHPRSMGQNFSECWRDAWPVIGAAHDSALAGNTAFLENQHIFLERHGYTEECFFTFSFSPIRDETGHLAGLFHPVIETTPNMLSERRTRTLRDLASGVSNAKSVEEAFTLSADALSEFPLDLPFLLIYLLDETEQQARLVAATGLAPGANGAPEIVPLNAPDRAAWPLGDVFRAGEAKLVDDVAPRFGSFSVGPYPEPIASVILLPIMTPGAEKPMAVVIAGVSPRLKSNEMYVGFHDLLSGAITTAVANADAYDAERRRAEAFAKIDRAKTEFFSNVSHEFRTPLTLMLGPLEDALAGVDLPATERERIDVAHRNSLRLLKLVNSLLDFSRIEAGRAQASYEPVDLADFTAELVSSFRSACERAELKLVVDCPPLPEPVYVDRDMWEKIVLNLLSNAFKFTFEGEIAVRLRADDGQAKLTVSDSGVGVPAAELPRMFERFHRVENQKGRSFEGSGIGLSLVQELVKLHGGSIDVESEVGRGTEFSISIPFGTEHLPHDRVAGEAAPVSTAVRAHAYVEEALRWLPDARSAEARTESAHVDAPADLTAMLGAGRSNVLLADDNADMRDYIRRLLGAHHDVEAVTDGEAALEAVRRRRPDLIITDVMMPKLDGLGLVRAIRGDAELSDLPIIMLSARAGEEASIEGLSAGADDYLVKPFSARELIARVNAALVMTRLRRENGEALREGEEQQRFLLALSDKMRPLADPAAIQEVACGLLGEQLKVDRAYYVEIDEVANVARVGPNYLSGNQASLEGELSLLEFGWQLPILRSGEMLVVADTQNSPFVPESDRAGIAAIGVGAVAATALIKDGVLVGCLALACGSPRNWVRPDMELIRQTGERIWGTIERARAEAKLRDLNATLEKRVTERTDELVQAQEALRQSQKLEAMGQLTGGVAHDFNNILTPIIGSLDMLQRKGVGGEREQRLIDGALQSAERAKTLIQRLLAFARRQPLQPHAVDVASLITGMGDLIASTSGPQVKVVIDIADDLPNAVTDPNQLEMAILNLSVNARDAMREGGTMTISAAGESVDAGHRALLKPGHYVRVSVADSGTGMDEATLTRAIEPFFSTKGVGKGTGLGLSMVHGLASQLGGGFALSSKLGLGTNVELWLPASDEAAVTVERPVDPVAAGAAIGTVLLVDDEELIRMSTADMLADLGYEVVEAASAEEALRLFDDGRRIDTLVTDHLMPGMTGADLAREVQAKWPGTAVLIVSGYADTDEIAPDLPRLTKPFRQCDLAASLLELNTA